MENVLVVGATGTTGRKVVNLLKSSPYFVPIAMVRKESQIQEFSEQDIQTVLGDLEKDISHTLDKIHKVVFAAGSGGRKVVEVDQEGAKKMIDASKNNKIKKFVMLSSMGADHPEKATELKGYLEAKHNADEYLKTSNIRYTIIRPGALTNDKGTGKIMIGKPLNKRGSISREDVAQVLTRTLYDDALSQDCFEIVSGNELIGKALDSLTNS
ncbi:putative sugar epimerase YhfK [Arenibacter antarcticus]|uniref:SDR family oxidoreductase n=1 Tax=Arenibacter antarcticus TaxID=2040469 RepID=A0ABW5VJ63_9FLAO|nr:SDR family oxidoreductase [Arenibacter sp. H213]MCM4166331.1 NAD-dependent dehydratase [Arenibacter sp. H213]